MQIVEYKDLLKICKDLNSKGKKIGRFSTTGKLHPGHLEGIKQARINSDIVVVIFCYYLPRIRLFVEGVSPPDYSDYQFSDIEILRALNIVDYVCFRRDIDGIVQELSKTRNLVNEEVATLINEQVIQPSETRAISQLTIALRVNPDEIYCHGSWTGDNNLYYKIANLIAKKHNLPINYRFYPIVRDETNTPYQSRFLNSDDSFELKKKIGSLFNDYKNKLLEDGKLNGNLPFKLIIREADTLKIVNSLESNKSYLFNASSGKIFDSIRIDT